MLFVQEKKTYTKKRGSARWLCPPPPYIRLWFVGETGVPNLRLNYQFSRKRNVHVYEIILCQSVGILLLSLNESRKSKIFLVWHRPSDPPKYIWNKPRLFVYIPLCSDFSPICNNIFIIIDQCRTSYYWDRP